MFNHTHTHTHISCSHLFICLPQINIQICECTQTVRMSLLKETKEAFKLLKNETSKSLLKSFTMLHYI